MARINILPRAPAGPNIMDEITNLLAGIQSAKQQKSEQQTRSMIFDALSQSDPKAALLSLLADQNTNAPTGFGGFLDRLNPTTPSRGANKTTSGIMNMLLRDVFSSSREATPRQNDQQQYQQQYQQQGRNISQAKDEVSDLEDDLKEITRQIDENAKFTESRFPPAQLQAMTRTQEKLKEMLGYARGNRQAAYGGNASTRSARQQYTDRRKQTPGGYEPAPADWQPPTRAAQAPNPARSGQAKKPIPRAVAAEIFKQAGNDPTRAAQMAEERGYDPRRFAD